MERLTEDILEAARALEGAKGTDGLIVVPATIRNVTVLQLMFRQVGEKLGQFGIDQIQANVINSPFGKPLLYTVDTRNWPEEAERAFLSGMPAVKSGKTLKLLNYLDGNQEADLKP